MTLDIAAPRLFTRLTGSVIYPSEKHDADVTAGVRAGLLEDGVPLLLGGAVRNRREQAGQRIESTV